MRKLIIITFGLLMYCGCQTIQQIRADRAPVEIDGFGSLALIKDRSLDYKQLEKVILAVAERQSVSQEDAQVLTKIYNRHAIDFIEATSHAGPRRDYASAGDAEQFLALILRHENTRDEVRKATEKAFVDSVAENVRFEATEGVIVVEGSLLAVYHNAYNRAVAGSNEKLRDDNYNRTMDFISFAAVVAFERAARVISTGQRADASDERKKRAADFLQDLKIYNDALPPDDRILDADGQLLSLETLDDKHGSEVIGIIRGSLTIIDKNKEAKDALDRLNRRIFPTYEQLSSATFQQIRRR
jgi:hypothetical protein